jgi:nicotinamide mononucleotide transporter
MPEEFAARLIQDLRATTAAEGAAVVLGLAYVLLAARGSRWCWPAGAAGSLLLAWLAWRAHLPMQALLNAWYVVMSVYGWVHWSRAENAAIRTWAWWKHAIGIALALGVAAVLAPRLAGVGAAWPRLDAASTLLSLLATWLVARRVLENWLYWIAIDAVLVFLFAAQGLAFVALQFVVYLIIAVSGFVTWMRTWRAQTRS